MTSITDRAEARIAIMTAYYGSVVPVETARELESIAEELAEAGNALLVKFPKRAERQRFHALYMKYQAMKEKAK